MKNQAPENRIYLSPPDQTGLEQTLLSEILQSNWIAPVGPHLEKFENLICDKTGFQYAVALNSATSALHLSLLVHNVGKGDDVVCNTLTFCAAANVILYVNASPVFIDSDSKNWNLDIELLEEYLQSCSKKPKAIILTHIYGMPADIQRIDTICETYGVIVIHNMAEAIGMKINNELPGKITNCGIVSFNGNKLITTGGGGAYLTNDKALYERVLYLSTQSKSKELHYQHEEIGYNYRMSNVLAGIGIAQMSAFEAKVTRKRLIFNRYKAALQKYDFVHFQEEEENHFSDRWLTCILIDKSKKDFSISKLIEKMESLNIETRHTWKPMHLQPIFEKYPCINGSVAQYIFECGICLPSGTSLTETDQNIIIDVLIDAFQ